MKRLLCLTLLVGCSGTSARIDVTFAGDVPALSAIQVRLFGTREIGAGQNVPVPAGARSGQIVINDINPALAELRVLLDGVAAGQIAAEGVTRFRPKAGEEVRSAAVLAAGRLADADADGIPDAIDDCPDSVDPHQDQTCGPAPDLSEPPDGANLDLARADLTQRDLAAPLFAIGGTVSGLSGTLVLRDNGGDDLTLTKDGPFVFAGKLASGQAYAVTVGTQPMDQLCTVMSGSGNVAGADVTGVSVTCVAGHTVGGMVTGLQAGPLVLQNNGGDALTVTASGSFTFATPIVENGAYAVTVATPAPGQSCLITNGSGTVGTTAVTDVMVACAKLAVVINEIYPRPATGAVGDTNGDGVRDSTQDEFVEIMNNDSIAADLSGWLLRTGAASLTTRFTFPPGSTLAPGARAVIFGGGTPTGSFGSAPTFSIGGGNGLSLTDGGSTVSLEAGTLVLDSFSYTGSTSCTTNCASQTRSPEGAGAFVAHPTAAGNAGILWSPGVDAVAAIPKLETTFSVPAPAATNVSVVAFIVPQFNMFMNAADFNNTNLKLFASSCAAMTSEVTSFSSIGAGSDASSARLVSSAPLAFATTYCAVVTSGPRSAINVALDAAGSWELTTRAAVSAPANNVVISEVGGCRLSSTGGTTACGGTGANDEFVELYNPTTAPVDISNWFVQRRAAGGTTTCGATIPAATSLAAGHYYLVGGAGYTASRYTGAAAADLIAGGSLLVGGSESVVLISNAGSCTGSNNVIDSVSFGAITDSLAALQLPPVAAGVSDGTSVERKACYNSTADASSTGMFPGGGHEDDGNSERIGAGNADWVVRPSPSPQNTAAAESRGCS